MWPIIFKCYNKKTDAFTKIAQYQLQPMCENVKKYISILFKSVIG